MRGSGREREGVGEKKGRGYGKRQGGKGRERVLGDEMKREGRKGEREGILREEREDKGKGERKGGWEG